MNDTMRDASAAVARELAAGLPASVLVALATRRVLAAVAAAPLAWERPVEGDTPAAPRQTRTRAPRLTLAIDALGPWRDPSRRRARAAWLALCEDVDSRGDERTLDASDAPTGQPGPDDLEGAA